MLKKSIAIVEKAKDLGEGILEAIVASSSKDRHGEILDINGLDISKYKQNPVVLWAHDYSKPPIGRTLSLKKQDGKLIAKIKFAIHEDEFAHKIYKLYKGGYMKAFSIGFIPLEMDKDRYTKSEMIEHSAVPVPANSEALALAVSKGLINKKDIGLLVKQKKGDNTMLVLKEVLAKRPVDLSGEERAFLIESSSELTDAQKAVYKDILVEVKQEDSSVDEKLASLSEAVENITKSLDTVEKKDIGVQKGKLSFDSEVKKEDKLKLWVKGLVTKDYSDYMNVVGKNAMNSTDDDAVLPPEEFIAEVSRLEEEFGVAARFANVRRTNNNNLRGVKGGDDLAFVKTAELGLKAKQATSYDPYNLTHLEYTGIVPVSDTLLEDSAIDLWNDITGRFARAAAQREDQLVFTENDVADDVFGILQASGTAQLSVGANIDAFDGADGADKLNEMLYAVPTPSMSNGRYFLHRTVLGQIQRMKDSEGRYIWQPGINGSATGTIWGMPYTLTEVLPSLNEIEAGDAFMIFGDLRNTTLSIRVPMQTKFFDSGVITDADGNVVLNLMQQDAQAIRARLRMNQVHVHPEAYSVLVAGSLS